MKEAYLDIMEKSLAGYTNILQLSKLDKTDDIQAYARITAVVTILAVKGKWPDYLDTACDMLSVCLRSIVPDNRLNDYAVKDIMIAYKYLKNTVSAEKCKQWQEALRSIDPEIHYVIFENKKYSGHIHNVNVYNMAAEHLRYTEGLCDTEEFVERHFERQLAYFDENGMYHDPNDPMLYDLTTRVQFLYLLGFGYNGKYKDRLEKLLHQGADMTLKMQSAAYELPYGGRSSQYLFNEALVCSVSEYEAAYYKKEGDLVKAGMFKRCARLSRESVARWLAVDPPRHIKNFFPVSSKAGTESYGYYDKYMASLGIFLHIALEWCDEEIAEQPCPAETGGYILDLPRFHKIMANCGGYSIEIDTGADYKYDSTGIGRIHAAGFPTELGLSLPFTKTPNYTVLGETADMSISAGWIQDGNLVWMSDRTCVVEQYKLTPVLQNSNQVTYDLVYHISHAEAKLIVRERHCISTKGVHIDVTVEGMDNVYYRVPLLNTNGKDTTKILLDGNTVKTVMGDSCYTVKTDADIKIDNTLIYNRNGAYQSAVLHKPGNQLSLDLFMERK